jgi:hypothetical protein
MMQDERPGSGGGGRPSTQGSRSSTVGAAGRWVTQSGVPEWVEHDDEDGEPNPATMLAPPGVAAAAGVETSRTDYQLMEVRKQRASSARRDKAQGRPDSSRRRPQSKAGAPRNEARRASATHALSHHSPH